jgi:hypothetical protein
MMARKCVLIALMAVLVASGCMTPRVSAPARTATEQLLLSTAADRTVSQMDLSALKGKKVFLDAANFEATDKAYAIAAVASRLNKQGALLVEEKKEADAVAVIRAGALSTDGGSFLLGIPKLSVPVSFGASVETPEIALVKKIRELGIAKFALSAHDAATGKHLLTVGPVSGSAYYNFWTVLLVPFYVSDIPEK